MKKLSTLIIAFVLCVVAGGSAQAQRITVTLAGNGLAGYFGENKSGYLNEINSPFDVCTDAAGNLYFSDHGNGRIRKINQSTGVTTTVVSGVNPYYMCMDASGNLFFSAPGAIYRVDAITSAVNMVAGTGTIGYSGDGGIATAAKIQGQLGICLDAAGNLYMADGNNNRIRKVNATTGIITTIAGTGTAGNTGDGGAAVAATLTAPTVLCANAAGDIFFADQGVITGGVIEYATGMTIRKISAATGNISTISGGPTYTYLFGGPAAGAYLGTLTGLCCDGSGNVYCCEISCSCRKIDVTTDSIYAVAGDFTVESYADNINSLIAYLDNPFGICVDAAGNMYVADNANNRIRKVIPLSNTPSFAYKKGQYIYPCPGSSVSFNNQTAITNITPGQTETWTVYSAPVHGSLSGFPYWAASKGMDSTTTPNGLTYTAAVGYTGLDSFKVMVSNGTLSDVMTIYVSVSAPSPISISGLTSFCAGTSVIYGSTFYGGLWSTSNPNASVSGGEVTGITGGIDTVLYTIPGVCNALATVNVIPAPDAGVVSGSGVVCLGGTTPLSDAVAGGVWSSSGTYAATISGTGLVTAVASGASTISYTVNDGTCSASATLTMVVGTPVGSIGTSGPTAVCVGNSFTLFDTIPTGTWSVINSHASVDASGTLTGISAGMDSVYYTVTNICGTANTWMMVETYPLPDAGTISSPADICLGATALCTESVPGGNWSSVYYYVTVDTGGSITGAIAGPDTLYYSVTSAYGCVANATAPIYVDVAPDAGTISGSNNITAGSSTALFNYAATGGVWSTTNSSVSTVSGAGLVYGVATGIDSIVYTVTNSCGAANTYFYFTVSGSTTGINNASAGMDKLLVMPNPAKDNFTVTVSSSKNEQVNITITSVTGAKLKEITGTTNQPIDASVNMPAGIYLVNAATATANMSGKIVIE